MLKKILIGILVCTVLIFTVSSAAEKRACENLDDIADIFDINDPDCALFDPGDILFTYDVESPSGDFQCTGVEFDGTYYYVTGGNSGLTPNEIHIFREDGSYITSIAQPYSGSGWGWRDIAFDGNHMYASDNALIDEWYITGLPDNPEIHEVESFFGPLQKNRALAYDPETDHFWTANFDSSIYEISRDGIVFPDIINTYENDLSIFGLAWDDSSPDGPWLWVYSQNGEPAVLISQFDPRNGEYTGVIYQGPYNSINDVAGGLCFGTINGKNALVGLTQSGDTYDFIFGMDFSYTIQLEIKNITGKWGGLLKGGVVSMEIENAGNEDIQNVEWGISVTGGILGRINISEVNVIDILEADRRNQQLLLS